MQPKYHGDQDPGARRVLFLPPRLSRRPPLALPIRDEIAGARPHLGEAQGLEARDRLGRELLWDCLATPERKALSRDGTSTPVGCGVTRLPLMAGVLVTVRTGGTKKRARPVTTYPPSPPHHTRRISRCHTPFPGP